MDKDEIIRTTQPGDDIPCKTCKCKLQPIEVMGEKVERYKFGTCNAYVNKPPGVIWNGEKCELYQPE